MNKSHYNESNYSVHMMVSSPSHTNGVQDLHENLLCTGDAGLSNQNELN